MKSLYEVIRDLPVTKIQNEGSMYSFLDLRRSLSKLKELQVDNECLTPFYVCNGKRMEFYYATLNIQLVDKYDFKGYLFRVTGKKNVFEISKEIISLQEQCHIEVLREAPFLSSARMLQYVDYISSMPDVISSIVHSFSDYDQSRMMFTFFHEE